MFTRKDYRAIAEIIRGSVEFVVETSGHCYNCKERLRNIVNELTDYFEQDNPNFNREKFLDACKIEN